MRKTPCSSKWASDSRSWWAVLCLRSSGCFLLRFGAKGKSGEAMSRLRPQSKMKPRVHQAAEAAHKPRL